MPSFVCYIYWIIPDHRKNTESRGTIMSAKNEYVTVALKIAVSGCRREAETLRKTAFAKAEEIYGAPLPGPVRDRLEEELEICKEYNFSPDILVYEDITAKLKSADLPFFLVSANGALLINRVLGISRVDPLPPHYRCGSCRHTEFIPATGYGTGFSLPDTVCPVCGKTMRGGGFDIRIGSYLGCKPYKYPAFALGVAPDKTTEAIGFFENNFGAKVTDPKEYGVITDGDCRCVYVDIIPVEGFPAKKTAAACRDTDDAAVFEYLSTPGSYECYLPYEGAGPYLKELLEYAKAENLSDLCRICGLTASTGLLEQILPSLKTDPFSYRGAITCRDDLYGFLASRGVDPRIACTVTKRTRQGRAAKLFEEDGAVRGALTDAGVTEDFIALLCGIKYLPSRAQAAELALFAYGAACKKICG